MVPRMAEYPFQRVPKVAFLFMTRGALPFAPLWDRFFKGHEGLFSVYVHSLPDYRLNVSKESAFYDRQIPSKVTDLLLLLVHVFFSIIMSLKWPFGMALGEASLLEKHNGSLANRTFGCGRKLK